MIQRQGADRILVQVPGLQDPSRLKEILGKTAKMTFRLVDTSMGPIKMRAEDHQALLPLAVAVVSKDAKFKADNTDKGFKTIKLLTGEQAASPVQPSCKMTRPPA